MGDNALQARTVINNVGLSSSHGEMEVNYNERWPLWTGSSLENLGKRTRIKGAKKLTVPVTTLDDYWNNHARFDCALAKMDVEGHEIPVLKGAKEFIATCKPSMLCEVLSLDFFVKLKGVFLEQGYQGIYQIDDVNLKVARLDPELKYASGQPYTFKAFHNVLFTDQPLDQKHIRGTYQSLNAAGIKL